MMSKAACNLCDLVTRLDTQCPLNPEDAEVIQVLIHGMVWSADMRALLHGIAAGIQARFAQHKTTAEERL